MSEVVKAYMMDIDRSPELFIKNAQEFFFITKIGSKNYAKRINERSFMIYGAYTDKNGKWHPELEGAHSTWSQSEVILYVRDNNWKVSRKQWI